MKAEVKNVIESLKSDSLACFEFVKFLFKQFIEFKNYCAKNGYDKSIESFAIVPKTEQEFTFMGNTHVIKMLLALDVVQPNTGEWYFSTETLVG